MSRAPLGSFPQDDFLHEAHDPKPHFTVADAAAVKFRRPGCRIYHADRWKPGYYRGRRFHFCIMDYGDGYYVMRLFDTAEDRDFYERRVKRWCNVRPQPQSSGRIVFKRIPYTYD